MRHSWFFVGLVAIAWSQAPSPAAADNAKRGAEIAHEADRRARGFGDFRAEMTMQLSDRRGQVTVRELSVATFEESPRTEKSLVVFSSPRDVRGTALLTYAHSGEEDDQWLYLPALRRAKRIAVGNRSSPFMGSEFAYEDLAATHVADFRYEYVGTEKLRGTECFVIDRFPTYSGSGYSKQRVWLDTAEYRALQIGYWDERGRKLKTLGFGKYALYRDRFWKPGLAKMINHQTNASTTLLWKNYRFSVGLSSSDFDKSALRRAR